MALWNSRPKKSWKLGSKIYPIRLSKEEAKRTNSSKRWRLERWIRKDFIKSFTTLRKVFIRHWSGADLEIWPVIGMVRKAFIIPHQSWANTNLQISFFMKIVTTADFALLTAVKNTGMRCFFVLTSFHGILCTIATACLLTALFRVVSRGRGLGCKIRFAAPQRTKLLTFKVFEASPPISLKTARIIWSYWSADLRARYQPLALADLKSCIHIWTPRLLSLQCCWWRHVTWFLQINRAFRLLFAFLRSVNMRRSKRRNATTRHRRRSVS